MCEDILWILIMAYGQKKELLEDGNEWEKKSRKREAFDLLKR